jgi:hypothetical protein
MTPQMITMMTKALGIDLSSVTQQAANIGNVFVEFGERLARIEANQKTLMAHVGCIIPMSDDETDIVNREVTKLLEDIKR